MIPVSPAFAVSQPAIANSTEFQSKAIESFIDHLGFSTCSAGGVYVDPLALTTVLLATVIATPIASNTSPSAGPNQNSTQPISTGISGSNSSSTQSFSTQSPGSHGKEIEIAIGVAIPVAFLVLVSLGFFAYRRWRIHKKLKEVNAMSPKQGSLHEDRQPYLQQKAELEAEEKRKHELEARERRYEMDNEGERYELPVGEQGVVIRTRQELRGEEHSKELEVPR